MTDQIDPVLVVLTGVGAFAAFRFFSGAGGDGGNDGDEKNGGDKGVARTSKFINKFGSVTRAREGDRLAPDRVDDDAPDMESDPPKNRQQESSGSGDGSSSSGGFEKSGRGDPLAGVAETEDFINQYGSVTRKRSGDPLSESAPDPEPDPPKEGGDVRLQNAASSSSSSSSSSGSDDSASDPEPNVDEEDVGLSLPGTDDRVFSVTRRR